MVKADDANVPSYYWDSCVFLSYFEETPGRIDTIDKMLDEARHGKTHLYTSILTISEVAFLQSERENGRTLDLNDEAKIDRMWLPPTPVKNVLELHFKIAYSAKELIRKAMAATKRLNVADAIHLASAIACKCKEFHTYDEPLDDLAGIAGLKICRPHIDQLPFPAVPDPAKSTPNASQAPR